MFGIAFTGGRMHIMRSQVPMWLGSYLFGSFDDYCVKLDRAIQWSESLGVSIDKSNRHYGYIRKIRSKERSESNLRAAVENDPSFAKVLFESTEFVRMYRNFDGLRVDGLQEKLIHYVRGPDFYTDENSTSSTNSARNYGVELSVGGELSMLGFQVQYDDASFPEPMLKTELGHIAIECKRPSSQNLNTIDQRLKDAIDRLTLYASSNDDVSRAIVVLDLTKYFNPACRVFVEADGISTSDGFKTRLKPLHDIATSRIHERGEGVVQLVMLRVSYPFLPDDVTNHLEWTCRPYYAATADGMEKFHMLEQRYSLLNEMRKKGESDTLKHMISGG